MRTIKPPANGGVNTLNEPPPLVRSPPVGEPLWSLDEMIELMEEDRLAELEQLLPRSMLTSPWEDEEAPEENAHEERRPGGNSPVSVTEFVSTPPTRTPMPTPTRPSRASSTPSSAELLLALAEPRNFTGGSHPGSPLRTDPQPPEAPSMVSTARMGTRAKRLQPEFDKTI